MERAVALSRLTKLLGKKLAWRIDPKAPSAEERATAKAELTAAVAERNKLKEKRDARYHAILAADVEYQTLHAEHKAAQKRTDELFSISRHFKITVGTNEGLYFLHKAEGDSWEEVIERLTAKEKQAA